MQSFGLNGLGTRRSALLWAASLVALVKCVEFAIDSQVLFTPDSGAFILNALGWMFVPVRSYVYGDLIREVALPFHSLRPLVAAQCAMGGLTAWIVCFCLIRYFKVRPWVAIVAALGLAIDPLQIMLEHLVMAETSAIFVMALYILAALHYLEERRPILLLCMGLLGAGLVSLRIVYVPVVLTAAIVVPLIAWLPFRKGEAGWRTLTLPLLFSCGCTLLFQIGYRDLTGRLAGREPAYHYDTGYFLLASVSPIVEGTDIEDPQLKALFEEQNKSSYPFEFDFRSQQLWNPEGFIARLRNAKGPAGNAAAQQIAWRAIRRDPLGFVRLSLLTYLEYWTDIRILRYAILFELNTPMVTASDARAMMAGFGEKATTAGAHGSFSSRYYLRARFWYVFLLISPLFLLAALFLKPACPKCVFFLLVWTCLLWIATCTGVVEFLYRYAHPFSFTALAGAGILCEAVIRNSTRRVVTTDRLAGAAANSR